ncbi:MAG: C1 family peptidase [Flavobacterium sp.]
MKSIKKKIPLVNGKRLNARPDTIDFRDRMYTATLTEVPPRIDLEEYKAVGVPILNQGTEGACTGFGLATMIHYLLRKRKVDKSEVDMSPRMLYEMAKKYDEWDGEDYVGSSARGAMKGWHKHGVCEDAMWNYDPKDNRDKELTLERAENAAKNPVGSYYRVNHKDLTDIHTAIAEVGILFATSRVHNGWFDIDENGNIPYDNQPVVGGHAFAIVAYDESGFWIQNSWGKRWGKEGFAKISYDDWLANGTDIWVARLGVPVYLLSANSIARSYSVATSVKDGLAFKDLRQHVISLGNDGQLKETGTYGNRESDVKRIFTDYIPAMTQGWSKKRIMFYAHGGLVSEKSVLQRLADYRQSLLANEIYPIFFVWNTDFASTIKNLIQDAFKSRKTEERVSSIFDFMLDRIDDGLEPLLRLPGKTMWDEMKENAIAASDETGGASICVKFLKEYLTKEKASIHLVAHSAGSIFLAPIVRKLSRLKIEVKTCTLWAPACTMDLFEKYYLPEIGKNIGRLALFTLSDEAEQNDNCFYIYNKSLLYLVSNSFEITARGTPILGMEKYIKNHNALIDLIDDNVVDWIGSPNTKPIPESCEARHHGDFDNDIPCFESTLKRILLSDPNTSVFEIAATGSPVQEGDLAFESATGTEDAAQAGTEGGAIPRAGITARKAAVAPSAFEPQIKMRPSENDLKTRREEINRVSNE